MTRERRILRWIFAAIIVVGVVSYAAAEHNASGQAHQNYENSIAGCHRANHHYRADTIVIQAAATYSSTPTVRDEAARALRELRKVPFVRYNGTTECAKAIVEP